MRFECGGAIELLKNLMTLIYMAGGWGAGGLLVNNGNCFGVCFDTV